MIKCRDAIASKKINYSNITTRIIYWRFYTLLFLDINVYI